MNFQALKTGLMEAPIRRGRGRLLRAVGPLFEADIPGTSIGSMVTYGNGSRGEVVGFREGRALIIPLDDPGGVAFGTPVVTNSGAVRIPVCPQMQGRVLDALGRPMDGGPPLNAVTSRTVQSAPPPPLLRTPVTRPLETGIRVIDGLLSLAKGQRIAVMSGSGVGKSTLLGMLARHVTSDVAVVCLVGERGREVRDFIERSLGEAGMAHSVVIAATSDASPALQVKAVLAATTVAEYFRDQGNDVLLLVDSLTRLAIAQRQIGLAAGEPPTARGYTPSVFAMLPKLLERAGNGTGQGSITGLYTVLVEGDDIHDPVADAVRGIVDGHIVLSRDLAGRGQFPAVDVLGSLSRLMDRVADPDMLGHSRQFRELLGLWKDNEELVRLGAYRRGSVPAVDRAIDKNPVLVSFLKQPPGERSSLDETKRRLAEAVS